MALALASSAWTKIGERIATLLNVRVPDSLLGKLAMLPQLAEVAKFPPKAIGGKAAVSGARDPRAGRRFGAVSRAGVLAGKTAGPISPSRASSRATRPTGVRNVGMYRIQVIGPRELAMHWQPSQGRGGALARDGGARREDARGDRAGRDPASIYAASAPLPPRSTNSCSPGSCAASPFGLAKALTSDLEVPAEAGDRARGLHRSARGAGPGGPVRRSHRLLLACRLLSQGARQPRSHAAPSRCGRTRSWGRPPWKDYWLGHATERIFPAAPEAHAAEVVDLAHAGRGDLSQSRLREHRQASIRGRPIR